MQVTSQGATISAQAHAHPRSIRITQAHLIVARVLLVGIFVQVFFAGLGVFTPVGFFPHVILGSALVAASLSLPILAGIGHLGHSALKRSWLLAGLMLLQGLLIDAGRLGLVYISALHPVNAMLILLTTLSLANVTSIFKGGTA
jgi:hypothetical protein